MRGLNTMFINKSNTVCNNTLFSSAKIQVMHPQTERLYLAAKELKKVEGQSDVARLLNISPQTLNNWEARGISKNGLLAAQKIVGCSAHWLETGFGPMSMSGSESANVTPALAGTRKVPLVSYVQAGFMKEMVAQAAASEWLLTDLELSENAFALSIKGDSMLPEFKEGDRVIIDPAVQPQPGDFVVAKNGAEEATFKKYRPRGLNERGDEVFELIPLNDDYPSMRSDVTPLKIIGTMIEHRRYRKK